MIFSRVVLPPDTTGFGSHESSVGNPEVGVAGKKMREIPSAKYNGETQPVRVGAIPSLERFQARSIWEMSELGGYWQMLSSQFLGTLNPIISSQWGVLGPNRF